MQSTLDVLAEMGAKLRPGADPLTVEKISAQCDIVIPPDARALYEKANGSEGEFGEWSWIFWPIDSEQVTLASYLGSKGPFVVGNDARGFNPKKYVRFFDCLIDLPLYAYCVDVSSPCFGEVIGCYTDGGKFQAFVAARSVARFLELFAASRGGDSVLISEEKRA
jgi:hypothetical protein